MHVSFALFADAANISQEGKLNILGVFDAVHVGQLPTLHPRATFVVRIKAHPSDAGDHAMTLRWINPRGAELWVSNAELSIAAPPPGTTELDMPVIVQLDLPLDLVVDRFLDEAKRVEVLDLRACAELLLTLGAHRDVGVTAERTFLHVAVADIEVAHEGMDLLHVRHGLLGRA